MDSKIKEKNLNDFKNNKKILSTRNGRKDKI